jgi:hypothetical protein
MAYFISDPAVISAAFAFHRPTLFSCFAACALNAGAVWFWVPVLMGQ